MRTAIYAGSFDPITYGHIDVLERAIDLFDQVIITVARNNAKRSLFSTAERVALVAEAVLQYPTVSVDEFDGLLVDFARRKHAVALVRGLRAISDFEYEFQMSLMNRKLEEGLVTVFLMPHEKYTYLNSSIVRELAALHRDCSEFVPPNVNEALRRRFAESTGG
jgi:pantetheine-phosphate adenylyltransferase